MTTQVVEPSATAALAEDVKPAEAATPTEEAAPPVASPSVGVRGLEFATLDDMWKFANFAHKSGWSPKNATPESNVVAMQFGAELGVGAMQSIQNITPIKGRPCAWGDLPLGLCMSSPYFDHAEFREWFTGTPGKDDYTAHCQARRLGGNVAETTFSVVDAKRAGLWEGARSLGKDQRPEDTIWYKYFKRMLMYRARGYRLRDTFPDVLKGLHTGEEMSDVDQIMSRLDLGQKSTPPTTESTADLRERLTKPAAPTTEPPERKHGRPPGSKSKPKATEPEPQTSERTPSGLPENPEILRKAIRALYDTLPPSELTRILYNVQLGTIGDINTMTDVERLRGIYDAFLGEVPPE